MSNLDWNSIINANDLSSIEKSGYDSWMHALRGLGYKPRKQPSGVEAKQKLIEFVTTLNSVLTPEQKSEMVTFSHRYMIGEFPYRRPQWLKQMLSM